jgi:hypothetical protein
VELASIILARTLGYIETFDLNPRGKLFYPDILKAIAERYKFQKFPTKPEEVDEAKGITFEDGKIGNKVIYNFTIYSSLLKVETRSSTGDSREILEELLLWAAAKFGLKYAVGDIKRFAYVSGISFYSEYPFLTASPILQRLAEKTSAAVSEIWQQPVHYETTGIAIGHDPLERKYGIAQFTLTRRAEARFSENKYYSEAPLPTDRHIALLEEYEAEIKRIHDR